MRLCVQLSMHRLRVKGEANIDLATLRLSLPEKETLFMSIKPLQSCLCVGKAYPAASRVVGLHLRQSFTVVPDNEVQMLIFLFCLNRDEPGTSLRFDPMADCIFDQRLKNESWKQG